MGQKADRGGLTRRDFLRRAAAGAVTAAGAAAGLSQGRLPLAAGGPGGDHGGEFSRARSGWDGAGHMSQVSTVGSGPNLIQNGDFRLWHEAGPPEHWQLWSPRPDIAPEVLVDPAGGSGNGPALKLQCHRFQCNGGVIQQVSPVSPKDTYAVSVRFRTKGLASPQESVHVALSWLGNGGRLLEKQYVGARERDGDWHRVSAQLAAPAESISARLELVLRWTEGGTVWFDEADMRRTVATPPRTVRLATACFYPEGYTPEENRELWAAKCSDAGAMGADIVCLGEMITYAGTRLRSAHDAREPVPGPTTERLGAVARQHRMHVVAGVSEWAEEALWNTAVLINREGAVAGKYRKTHLPEEEVLDGTTPGSEYPVFQTDFARVGIEICYDNFFPEVARSLALNGAEIIFLPIWGSGDNWEVLARARSIDNCVYLVASNYSERRSLIIDPWGHILADTKGDRGLVAADVDLTKRGMQQGLGAGEGDGEWKTLWPGDRRPSTYRSLVDTNEL